MRAKSTQRCFIFLKMDNDKKTSEVIKEKGIWVMFGCIPIRIKPLTLSQIWEIGEIVSKCEVVELNGKFNAIEKMLSYHEELKHLQEIVIKAVFRGSVARFLFGRYIKHKTTMNVYKQVVAFCAQSFDAPFFFQSMTFLRGAKEVTMNTREAQARGDLSEE